MRWTDLSRCCCCWVMWYSNLGLNPCKSCIFIMRGGCSGCFFLYDNTVVLISWNKSSWNDVFTFDRMFVSRSWMKVETESRGGTDTVADGAGLQSIAALSSTYFLSLRSTSTAVTRGFRIGVDFHLPRGVDLWLLGVFINSRSRPLSVELSSSGDGDLTLRALDCKYTKRNKCYFAPKTFSHFTNLLEVNRFSRFTNFHELNWFSQFTNFHELNRFSQY